jgi:hypothetical protein
MSSTRTMKRTGLGAAALSAIVALVGLPSGASAATTVPAVEYNVRFDGTASEDVSNSSDPSNFYEQSGSWTVTDADPTYTLWLPAALQVQARQAQVRELFLAEDVQASAQGHAQVRGRGDGLERQVDPTPARTCRQHRIKHAATCAADPSNDLYDPAVSPDGTTLAVTLANGIGSSTSGHIALYDHATPEVALPDRRTRKIRLPAWSAWNPATSCR